MAPSAAFIPFPSVCAVSRQQLGQLLSGLIRVFGELEFAYHTDGNAGFISIETTSEMKGKTKRLMKTKAALSPAESHLWSDHVMSGGRKRRETRKRGIQGDFSD